MTKKLISGIVVLTVSVLFFVTYSLLTSEGRVDPDGTLRATFHASLLGEERELIIHLPRRYDSTRTYPVMYVLDGSSLDFSLAEKLEVLSAEGKVPEVIVVGIPNMTAENRETNLTPPFMRRDNDDPESDWGEGDTFLRFMETELIPFVEKSYPCSKTRLFAGNSRGGLLAMYSLLYKPELFQARFCFSTPFWRQDYILVKKLEPVLASLDTLNTFLYVSAGERETDNIRNGMAALANLLERRAPPGMTYHTALTSGATHQDNAEVSASGAFSKWGEYVRARDEQD